jgi:AcrR family transcriptional regulator
MTSTSTAQHLTPRARRILEVASQLFYRHGIHAVGVDTIAAASGVTKRTLYDRFGSKDALVTAYLQQRHDTWWARLERRLASASHPRALAVFDAYTDDAPDIARGCAFLNGAAELSADHPGLDVIRSHKNAVRQRLAELVSEDCPDRDDQQTIAEHLFLLLEGAIAHRGIDNDDHRLTQARDLARALLCR